MYRLPFVKMSATGNDFIVANEADCRDIDPVWLAQRLCARAFSVGADGLIVVGPKVNGGVQIQFFNSDGSFAEMCGNGSRCAARFAVEHGFAHGRHFQLVTDSGLLDVSHENGQIFDVAMPTPVNFAPNLLTVSVGGRSAPVHSVQVGVPHAIVVVDAVENLSDQELVEVGRALRHDSRFPEGTNVNFVTFAPDGTVRQRTYERGVEGLTYACGSGATATAFTIHTLNTIPWPVKLTVDGGRLTITERDGQLWLSGDTRVIATGIIEPDAFTW